MNEFLSQWMGDSEYVLRLLVALLCGAAVGLERESHGRAAGLRTLILVCMGSAAVIVAFEKLFDQGVLAGSSIVRIDPARAAAGVITGIGFLGAGTIIKSGNFIRGLTTAASVWVVSAVGIIVGLGQYDIAVVLTLAVLVTLYALNKIPIRSDIYAVVRLSGVGGQEMLDRCLAALDPLPCSVRHLEMDLRPTTAGMEATAHIRYQDSTLPRRALEALRQVEGLERIVWR